MSATVVDSEAVPEHLNVKTFLELRQHRNTLNLSERCSIATRLREEGNQEYKRGAFEVALVQYAKGRYYVEETGSSESESGARQEDRTSCFNACVLNSAVCLLKLKRFDEVIAACTLVLNSTKSVKALMRRAEAYIQLKEFGLASRDIEGALICEPYNTALKRSKQMLEDQITNHQTKMSSTYSKMFASSSSTSSSTMVALASSSIDGNRSTTRDSISGSSSSSSESRTSNDTGTGSCENEKKDVSCQKYAVSSLPPSSSSALTAVSAPSIVETKKKFFSSSMFPPIFLLADSNPFFNKSLKAFPDLVRSILAEKRTKSNKTHQSSKSAVYIGVCNGNSPDFFTIFVCAMEQFGFSTDDSRMISTQFSSEERGLLMSAEVLVIGGGDPKIGWTKMQENGMDMAIRRFRERGGVIIGVSAGAMILGVSSWAEPVTPASSSLRSSASSTEQEEFQTLGLVPLLLSAHDEKNDWQCLQTALRHLAKDQWGNLLGIGLPAGSVAAYESQENSLIQICGLPFKKFGKRLKI